MASLSQWVGGARPRTLPTAVASVAVGTGLAVNDSSLMPVRALLALLVAIALQVGVNYANDYSDGIKGTDEARVGPVRLVGQRLATPASVRLAAFMSFAVAAILGVILVGLVGQWWLLLVGVASVAAAWLYTGGPSPYGYFGLGEVFVFVFFGLVPVVGTYYVQSLTVTASSVIASVAVGLLACAVLVTNNLRDIPTDTTSGKRTLAVRLGDSRTRLLYLALVIAAGGRDRRRRSTSFMVAAYRAARIRPRDFTGAASSRRGDRPRPRAGPQGDRVARSWLRPSAGCRAVPRLSRRPRRASRHRCAH